MNALTPCSFENIKNNAHNWNFFQEMKASKILQSQLNCSLGKAVGILVLQPFSKSMQIQAIRVVVCSLTGNCSWTYSSKNLVKFRSMHCILSLAVYRTHSKQIQNDKLLYVLEIYEVLTNEKYWWRQQPVTDARRPHPPERCSEHFDLTKIELMESCM